MVLFLDQCSLLHKYIWLITLLHVIMWMVKIHQTVHVWSECFHVAFGKYYATVECTCVWEALCGQYRLCEILASDQSDIMLRVVHDFSVWLIHTDIFFLWLMKRSQNMTYQTSLFLFLFSNDECLLGVILRGFYAYGFYPPRGVFAKSA